MLFASAVKRISHAQCRGGSRILGKGGPINIFTTGGGPVTARASRGTLKAPSVGSGASPQPLFCFCVYLA